MNMKRFLLCALALVLIATFCACNYTAPNDSDKGQNQGDKDDKNDGNNDNGDNDDDGDDYDNNNGGGDGNDADDDTGVKTPEPNGKDPAENDKDWFKK